MYIRIFNEYIWHYIDHLCKEKLLLKTKFTIMSPMSYPHKDIEAKWQKYWENNHFYQADDKSPRPKYYALDMFPYPSGDLHIGHWYAFVGPDIHARYQRMNGYNVMQPIGFDAFGLPAENAAIKRNLHPQTWTCQNIASMQNQFKATGFSFDWSRMVDTSDPEYYKWTQWMFLQLYKHDLAYRKMASVNWCEHDQTVLANEQVENGLCWRCGNVVIQKELEQWFFKITHYAQELLDGLEHIDWPKTTKQMQKNWIGKSEGALIQFKTQLAVDEVDRENNSISVFTTRPDTLFGVSYIVLAPEHKLVTKITTPDKTQQVTEYVKQAQHRSERDRQTTIEDKTGVFTGGYALHPLTQELVPIWVADYVLGTYGTGAVMGVPAHDQRDQQFAQQHQLPIKTVIEQTLEGQSVLVNSGSFTGLTVENATKSIVEALENQQSGQLSTTYRLRDWLVSRQRYWGAPIPIIDCPSCGLVPVPEQDLPVILPQDVDFLPKGKAPLATNRQFMEVACPKCGKAAQRVAETLDTFVDSSWYYFRYADPNNRTQAFSPELINKWMPVDMYVGGAEHTVLHLLYSRFFTKALRDMGYVQVDEPFQRLRHQGMILGPDHQKMSKSKGNVVNPDELVEQFGADAVRMQLVFLGPYDQGGPWQLTGIHGVARFLQRVWDEQRKRSQAWTSSSSNDAAEAIRQNVRKIGQDVTTFKFNTAVAELMKTINTVSKAKEVSKNDWESFIITLAPFAPHIAEDLWHSLGKTDSIHVQGWPKSDLSQKQSGDTIDIAVQINGKFRGLLSTIEQNETKIIDLAVQLPAIENHLRGKKVTKHIYVPGKVINLITN
jgi:leucyl-tRNA synthetase